MMIELDSDADACFDPWGYGESCLSWFTQDMKIQTNSWIYAFLKC